jgi:spermidine synthase
MASNHRPATITAIVFVLSGSAALIFETAWFRIVGLTLGSSVWSAAAVLMAFMTGLGIGNLLVTAYGHYIRKPFNWYALAEILIGVFGLLSVVLLPGLSPAIASGLAALISDPTILNAARFAIAFTIFLIPAIAMGATLPILQKGLFQYNKSFAKSLAHLYGWNTIGAVTGVLLAEFLLIEFIGVTGAAGVACVFNLAAALILFKHFQDAEAEPPQAKTIALSDTIFRLGFSLFPPFLTGLILLALEVVWFRYLLLTQSSTSAVFAVMLAVVLIGIGSGGLIVSRLKLVDIDLDKLLFRLCLLAPVVAVLSFYSYSLLYVSFFDQIYGRAGLLMIEGIVLMLPSCILSGVLFPLFGEKLHRKIGGTTSPSGALTFANTLGSAVGTGLATFLMLPLLGIEYSILTLALVYILVTLIVVLNSETLRQAGRNYLVPAGALALVLVIFPYGALTKSYEVYAKEVYPREQLVAVKEGVNETLQYYRHDVSGRPASFRLVTNSHSMSATNFQAQRYMRLYAYMPYLLHDEIKSVLQISYGVGVTAEAVVSLPDMSHFDIVDISQDVLSMSDVIHEASGLHPQKDPRSRVHVEDGRFFLQTTDNTYDLITAEPPPPKNAGVVNLYSQEYFDLIRSRLNQGGIVSYWVPAHTLHDGDTLAITRAFCNVFPDCSMWNSIGLEFMLIGSNGGIDPAAVESMRSRWTPEMAAEMWDIGIEQPEQLGAMFVADNRLLQELTEQVPPVTDNFPMRISHDLAGVTQRTELEALLVSGPRRYQSYLESEYIRSIFPRAFIRESLRYFKAEAILVDLTVPSSWNVQIPLDKALVYLLGETDLVVLPVVILGGHPEVQKLLENGDEPVDFESYEQLVIKALSTRDYAQTISLIEVYLNGANVDPDQRERYAALYYLSKALGGTLSETDLALNEMNTNYQVPESFLDWMKRDFL